MHFLGDPERITTKRPPLAGFTKSTKAPQDVGAALPIGTVALVFLVALVLKNVLSRRPGRGGIPGRAN